MALCCEGLGGSDTCLSEDETDKTIFHERKGTIKYFKPGDLIRPLGSIETLMGVGGCYDSLNTIQAIWLESKDPIKEQNVSDAIGIMSKEIPHLHLCLARRGWGLWFRRIKNFTPDFETSTKDVMESYNDLLDMPYNMWTGPLWRVRMIIANGNDISEDQKTYSAVLIFCCHHSITDGTANMKMCRSVVSTLNKMNLGEPVIPKPVSLGPIIDDDINTVQYFTFIAKHFCKKFTATMIKNFNKKTSFKGILPIPKRRDYECKVIFDHLNKEETKNLIKMCKVEKITVHSLIVTAANLALIKVAQCKANYNLGKCSISVTHCVNMRRYFEPHFKDVSGCHISLMEDKSKMYLSEGQDFWNLARRVHNSIKERLEVDAVKVVPLLQVASMIFPTNNFLQRNSCKNKTDSHYVTTNMGNLKDMLPGPKEGDSIEITYLLRSVSAHLAGNPFLLTFHTFRDHLMVSIDYYTNKMTDQTAQEFFQSLYFNLKMIAKYGALQEPPPQNKQKCENNFKLL